MERKIMGLDYGEARTGVAISDALGITAQGIESINHKGEKKLILRIGELINQYNVSKIVLGLPINMNATYGERAQKTKLFAEKLKKEFNIEVEFIDERLTTVISQKTMTSLSIKKEKKKQIVDTMSAMLILQTYLDKNNLKEGEH